MITISWSQFKFLSFCLLIRTYVTIMEIQKYNWFILLHRTLFIKKVTNNNKKQHTEVWHMMKNTLFVCAISCLIHHSVIIMGRLVWLSWLLSCHHQKHCLSFTGFIHPGKRCVHVSGHLLSSFQCYLHCYCALFCSVIFSFSPLSYF